MGLLNRVKWMLNRVSTCVSQVAKDVEHFFMCLLATYIFLLRLACSYSLLTELNGSFCIIFELIYSHSNFLWTRNRITIGRHSKQINVIYNG